MLSRAEVLAELATVRPVIGLTGTHGKTTATSMMVHVLAADGRDAGRLLGADVLGVGANGHWGSGDVVVEVDESYGDVRALTRPHALGLLNVEADHLDHYGTLGALESAFAELVDRTTGPVVIWSDDPGCQRVAHHRARERACASAPATTTLARRATSRSRATSAHFILSGPDEVDATSRSRSPGVHNVADAAVVAVLARELGVSADAVRTRSRATFAGRRGASNSWGRGAASTSTRVTRTCPARSARSSARRAPPVTNESPRSSNRIA